MSYEEDKKKAIEELAKIDPTKPLGTELFNAIFRVSVGVAIETVAIRRSTQSGELEVLFAWRNENAPAYKKSWHSPGSYKRPGENEETAIKRIAEHELGCEVRVLQKVGWLECHEERGSAVNLVLLIELLGEPKGTWFPTENLPPETITFHRDKIIPLAVEAFRQREEVGKMRKWQCPICDFKIKSAPFPRNGTPEEIAAWENAWKFMQETGIEVHLPNHFPKKDA